MDRPSVDGGRYVVDIVCLPGALYDKFPPTNRQQVMNRLAGRHRVLFVEPPRSLIVQLGKVLLRRRLEQQPMRWFRRLLNVEERKPNLYLHPLVQFLPTKNRRARHRNYRLNARSLRTRIRQLGLKNYVLWIYSPDAFPLISLLDPALVCYDCVDEYTKQPYYRDHFRGLAQDEYELLKCSDLVFVSARPLYESKRSHNSSVHLVPNVAEYDHFAKAQQRAGPTPDELQNLSHPMIGFVGAMDTYKVDFDLLRFLAMARPHWSFVLIGASGQAERSFRAFPLADLANVHWIGPKPYESLPTYIQEFDVCIIPYVLNDYTRCCFPLKFHEFLSTGKPVVSTALPALAEFGALVPMADDYEEFLCALQACIKRDDDAARQRRIEVARRNTWESKASHMMDLIREHMADRRGAAVSL